MTEVSIDELKQARYMSLTSPPASPEAKRLVDSIIDIILDTEQRKRARQPGAAVAFKSAVGLIVGDLLIGLQTREAGWSYLSLSTAAFSDRPIGYWTFKRTVQAMETAGLLDVSLGRNSQAIDFGGGQKPERMFVPWAYGVSRAGVNMLHPMNAQQTFLRHLKTIIGVKVGQDIQIGLATNQSLGRENRYVQNNN